MKSICLKSKKVKISSAMAEKQFVQAKTICVKKDYNTKAGNCPQKNISWLDTVKQLYQRAREDKVDVSWPSQKTATVNLLLFSYNPILTHTDILSDRPMTLTDEVTFLLFLMFSSRSFKPFH